MAWGTGALRAGRATGVPWRRLPLLLLAVICLPGCPRPPVELPPPDVMPTYHEVIERYNANATQISRLWAHATTELDWNENKHHHFEQGEGVLMVVLPDRTAFSIGKLGNTMFWAGSDDKQYWLFDLRDDPVAQVGKRSAHRPAEGKSGSDVLLPIYPPDLTRVLGIIAIDKDAMPPAPAVKWAGRGFLIEPPGTSTRMVLDPKTLLPIQIDLIDAQGNSRLSAKLSKYEAVDLEGRPPGGLPMLATRFELTLPDRDGRMTLYLSDMSDGQDKITDRAFDLQKLIHLFKAKVHDLDAKE